MDRVTLFSAGGMGIHVVEQQQHEEVDLMEEVEEYGEFEEVEEKEDEEVAKVDRVQLALIYSLQLAEAYVSHVKLGLVGVN